MKYVIGIDTGTSGTKAIALSHDGKVLGQAARSYSSLKPIQPGWNEQEPERLFQCWVEVLRDTVKSCEGHELTAVSLSTAMHGIMAVDESGKPLSNLITWADLRSDEVANELHENGLAKELFERSGTPVHPMSPLCKLIWMKAHWPEIFRRASRFISIKEYFLSRLSGEYLIDHSIATATGMFDIHKKEWNETALRLCGITADQLSRPVSTSYILKGIEASFATEIGLDPNTPFVIGASDGCLANLGSLALQEGDVSLTVGTSGAVRMIVNKPMIDPDQRLFTYILTDDLYVCGGPINNGGILLKWYAEQFLEKKFSDASDFSWFVEEAKKVNAGADSLIFLPYIQGERAPVWNANAKGVFFGVRSEHSQAHFMRAIVESVCYALAEVLQTMEKMLGPAKNVFASGGFIRSQSWLQMMADVLNHDLRVLNNADASAIGACLLALRTLGVVSDFTVCSSFFERPSLVVSDREVHSAYRRNLDVYQQLYPCLQSLF